MLAKEALKLHESCNPVRKVFVLNHITLKSPNEDPVLVFVQTYTRRYPLPLTVYNLIRQLNKL